jgi:TatD DNase family protein
MVALEDSPRVSGVLHSFSGDVEMANWAADLGFFVGVSGPVTFKKSLDLQTVARQIDFGRLLVETDAPFLAPAPHRGKRNEPGYVRFVAQQIAELRDCELDSVVARTRQNALTLFKRLNTGRTTQH